MNLNPMQIQDWITALRRMLMPVTPVNDDLYEPAPPAVTITDIPTKKA